MKYSTFTGEMKSGRMVEVPVEICNQLDLKAGDKVEVSIKKIKPSRLDVLIRKNPLYKLLNLEENE
ncbi:MAG: hypothetical protein Kow0037_00290 [Calditrichia bacterium]